MKSTKIERKIEAWVERAGKYFLVLLSLIFIGSLVVVSYERNLCSRKCLNKGFVDYRYKPFGRLSSSACYCLNKQEAELKRKVPRGTRIDIYSE